jgi:carboxyl-terminal processing protease
MIFDYGTHYFWAHPDIKTPSQFSFTDKDFSDFEDFLKSRNFNYTTATEESINELIANAKKEKYFDLHKDLFTDLQKEVAHDLNQDLNVFRNEIQDLLEEDIIGRYFYEGGSIAWTIKKDEQVNGAIEILNNKEKYSAILSGRNGSILISGK